MSVYAESWTTMIKIKSAGQMSRSDQWLGDPQVVVDVPSAVWCAAAIAEKS